MEKDNTQEVKSKRELFMDRLKAKYPDRDFADDEAIFDAVNSDYDAADANNEKVGKYEQNSKQLVEMFAKNPRMGSFFNACRSGEDPIAFLIENFGDDFKNALESEEGKAKYADKYQAWLEKVAKEKELEEQAGKNLDETLSVLEAFQKEKGLTDEQATAVFDWVHQVILDGIVNKVSRETFEMASKALNYDTDVAEANRLGRVQGRNDKIEEKLRKKEAPADVPPTLNSASTKGDVEERKPKRRNPFKVYEDDFA